MKYQLQNNTYARATQGHIWTRSYELGQDTPQRSSEQTNRHQTPTAAAEHHNVRSRNSESAVTQQDLRMCGTHQGVVKTM